jgi:hypothetical protein
VVKFQANVLDTNFQSPVHNFSCLFRVCTYLTSPTSPQMMKFNKQDILAKQEKLNSRKVACNATITWAIAERKAIESEETALRSAEAALAACTAPALVSSPAPVSSPALVSSPAPVSSPVSPDMAFQEHDPESELPHVGQRPADMSWAATLAAEESSLQQSTKKATTASITSPPPPSEEQLASLRTKKNAAAQQLLTPRRLLTPR